MNSKQHRLPRWRFPRLLVVVFTLCIVTVITVVVWRQKSASNGVELPGTTTDPENEPIKVLERNEVPDDVSSQLLKSLLSDLENGVATESTIKEIVEALLADGRRKNRKDEELFFRLILENSVDQRIHDEVLAAIRLTVTKDHLPLLTDFIRNRPTDGKNRRAKIGLFKILRDRKAIQELIKLINNSDFDIAVRAMNALKEWNIDDSIYAEQCMLDLKVKNEELIRENRVLSNLSGLKVDNDQYREQLYQFIDLSDYQNCRFVSQILRNWQTDHRDIANRFLELAKATDRQHEIENALYTISKLNLKEFDNKAALIELALPFLKNDKPEEYAFSILEKTVNVENVSLLTTIDITRDEYSELDKDDFFRLIGRQKCRHVVEYFVDHGELKYPEYLRFLRQSEHVETLCLDRLNTEMTEQETLVMILLLERYGTPNCLKHLRALSNHKSSRVRNQVDSALTHLLKDKFKGEF